MKKLFLLLLLLFIFLSLTACSTSLNGNNSDGLIEEGSMKPDQLSKDIDDLIDKSIENEVIKDMTDVIKNPELDSLKEEGDREPDQLSKDIDDLIDKSIENEVIKDMTDGINDANIENEELIMKSCNAIEKSSTCIDYIGSFWSGEQKKYHCMESGTLSDKICENGNIGGCEIGGGGPSDLIIWMYPYGGNPIPSENAKTAKLGCDMNPMGRWLSAR